MLMKAQEAEGTSGKRARRQAIASLWMLPAFGLWVAAFIAISSWLAGGEVGYIKPWLPWLGAALLSVVPLAAGVVLGVLSRRRGGGRLALIGIVLNAVLLAWMTVPPFIEKLISG